jgi:dihydroxyacetone kinase
LIPCAEVWNAAAKNKDTFKAAFVSGADAAVKGAERTKEIVARLGRAENAGERSLGYPDAGAYALGVIFSEIMKTLRFAE